MEAIITTLVVIAIILITIAVMILIIRNALNRLTRKFLRMNLDSAADMISKGLQEETSLPKPICQLSAVYRPKIIRDFPEMNYEGIEDMVKNGLIAAFNAIEAKNPELLRNASVKLKDYVNNVISDNESKNEDVFYDDVLVHKISPSDYKKDDKSAMIVFELSLQGHIYRMGGGKIKSGSKDNLTQSAYKVRLAYNQEEYLESSSILFGSNCPNCGAPVSAVGKGKICSYCGTGLSEISDRVWQIDSFELLK